MKEILKLLPEMKVGNDLISELTELPQYDENIVCFDAFIVS